MAQLSKKHRHIVETGLTLLANASIPLKYWDEAFRISVCLINRLPTPTLNGLTPIEALFKVLPQYNSLRVFGSSCFRTLETPTNINANLDTLNALSLETA